MIPFIVFGQLAPREYFKVAKSKYDAGQYFESVDYLDKAIAQDPGYESALFLRGQSFLALKKYQLAIDDLTRIIEMRNTYDTYAAEYFLNRAVAYRELKNFIAAEKDLEKAISLHPDNPEAFYELAKYKFATLKNKNEAIRELDRAIQHDPEKAEYYLKRAEYKAYMAKYDFSSQELYESAIRDVSFAISLEPDNFEYYLMRSKLHKERGEPVQALEDYNKMIEINPGRVEAYAERGIIKMQSDRYESAIEDFSRTIELNPNAERFYRYRALCRHNLVDFDGAYDDYSRAIELLTEELNHIKTTENSMIKRTLADTYIKRGAAAIQEGNSYNACGDFRKAYELGSKLGLNYLRKYCGI